ncbi:MAG TPA: hypothetical protein VK436_17400, partial [Methanocella sp.]|nr:hypothetical protein [Methanocella sp.]
STNFNAKQIPEQPSSDNYATAPLSRKAFCVFVLPYVRALQGEKSKISKSSRPAHRGAGNL